MLRFSNETKIALFAIAAVAVFIWGFKFLKGINILTTSRSFYVRYENVDQLQTSSPVFVKGLQVGMVKDLYVDKEDDKTIIAVLNIDKDIDIPKDATALIKSLSVMGGKAVELVITRACEGADCAKSGDFLRGSSQSFMQSIVGDPAQIDLYTERLQRGLTAIYDSIADPRDPQGLGRSLVAMEKSLLNIEILTGKLNRFMDASTSSISATAVNAAELTKALRASEKDVQSAIANMDTLIRQLKNAGLDKTTQKAGIALDSMSQSLGDLRKTLKTTQAALGNVDILAKNLVDGKGLVGKTLTDEELYANLVSTSRHLHLFLQDLRLNPKRYNTVKLKIFGKNKQPGYANPLEDPAYKTLIDSLERDYSRRLKQ
jgi:phospholipid/cholesterol/gamma-HCH transport system substrate-binding protein